MLNSLGVRLFREPDAGNLPVRFDERQQETEPSHTGLRRRRVSLVSSHPRLQPLVLDATPPARGIKGSLVGSLSVWIPNNLISGEGFLGTGAPLSADLNLVVQVLMGGALLMGTFLARRKHYRAHAVTQTTVLLLNLAMIATLMWPSTK